MKETLYKITLADGMEIDGLRMNGNNFISSVKITEDIFEDNLSSVVISDGTNEEEHGQMELVQITTTGDEYWFVLRDVTPNELYLAKLRADIDYVGMMTDVDIPL